MKKSVKIYKHFYTILSTLMAQVLNDLAYLTNGLYVDFLSVFKDQNKKMPKLISQLAHTS